jgi:voltage-dependent potassium channel beta subunit
VLQSEYKLLGSTGLKLSRLSLGSWLTFAHKVVLRDAKEILAYSLGAGVNFFDTAERYAGGAAQTMFGDAFHSLGTPRDSYCLSSKVFWGGDLPTQRGLCRKHVFDCCHNSLERLRTDYLDIYFCHRPDPDTPILETAWAMNDLITQGKVMYWGTSEWTARQIRTAFKVTAENGLHPPVAEQPPYNLLNRDRYEFQTQPIARRLKLGVLSTTPLSSGILSAKYLVGNSPEARLNTPENAWLRERLGYAFEEEGINKVRKVQQLAKKINATPAQVAIAWCLLNPTVTSVITGASNMQQLRENLATTEVFRNLDKSALDELKQLVAKTPLVQVFDWCKIRSRPTRHAVRNLFGR